MSSPVIPDFNEDIAATRLIYIDTLSLPMSHFLRTLLCSLPPTLPVLMSYLYLFFILSRLSHLPPVDSSPMAPSSPTPVLSSPANLFIVVRKGTHSSRNLHLIYNFLTYHRLSSPYQPSFGITQSTSYHSIFYHHTSSRECIYLIVYVDDIVITDSDQDGIWKLKQHLFNHFQTKD